ncbi:MAG: hypothetical protein M3291_14830, partial [Actinomycetota bacterium]|nr:hypothetical protein [Actinomycetota bacterium]
MATGDTRPPGRKRASATAKSPAPPSDGDGDGFGTRDEQALEELLGVLTAARDGDFSGRLRARRRDVVGEVQQRTNELIALNARMAK